MCFILLPCINTYITHTCEWSLSYLCRRWKEDLFIFKSFFFLFSFFLFSFFFLLHADRIRKHKAIWLPPYKPLWLAVAHQLKWPYRTCSKTNSCNSLSTHLPYGLQTHKVAHSWNTTVHHMYAYWDYGLQTHRPTRQLICKKINSELTACLYTQVIATQLPGYPHKHILAIFRGSLQTCQQSYASSYP